MHVSAELAARLADGYRAGATVYELADQYGIHRETVSTRIKEAGVTMRRRSLSDAQIDSVVELYQQGLTTAQVAERFGVGKTLIRTTLVARGVPRRRGGRQAHVAP